MAEWQRSLKRLEIRGQKRGGKPRVSQAEGGRLGAERLPPCLCVKGSVPKDGDSCSLSPMRTTG